MAFQNVDSEPGVEEAGPPPEESSNRPFLIAVAILGGIFLISLLCIAAYLVLLRPMLNAREEARRATVSAQNIGTASAATLTAEAQLFTATPTVARSTNTPTPTNTPVVVLEATNTPLVAETGNLTATFEALQTTVVASQRTLTPMVTATGLPAGGWADEVGAPTLVAAAVVLIVVIFLARRLRTAGT